MRKLHAALVDGHLVATDSFSVEGLSFFRDHYVLGADRWKASMQLS